MLREFKTFIMRGNVVDLAVAVVLGVAFGAIITSFVNDLLMPPIGLVLGRVSFSDLFISLSGRSYPTLAAAKAAGAPTLNYGVFLNTIVNFVIVAFAVFLVVRQVEPDEGAAHAAGARARVPVLRDGDPAHRAALSALHVRSRRALVTSTA